MPPEALDPEWMARVGDVLAGAAGAALLGLIFVLIQAWQIRDLQHTIKEIVLGALAKEKKK